MYAYRTGRRQRTIALRYRLAVACACLLATILAAGIAYADGIITTSPPPLSTLVKFGDRQYAIAYDQGVSLEPISSSVVRKVGYGRVSEVNVARTATGTYSSDGLVSPHVLYPGIDVRRVHEDRDRSYHHAYYHPHPGPGFSILTIGRDPASGAMMLNAINERGVRSCAMSGSFATCYRTY